MTLDYNEELCNGKARYITRYGNIIDSDGYEDYSSHQAFSIADVLVNYFTYYIDNTNFYDSLSGKNKDVILTKLNELKSNYSSDKMTDEIRARIEIIDLLINCYQNDDFAKSFGRKIIVLSKESFLSTNEASHYTGNDDEKYRKYIIKNIIPEFKDVMISYLGYDATESKVSNTISSSSLRINERFYNYLLMDYTIVKMPKYKFDTSKKIYLISEDEFFYKEKEEMLDEEIKSLKLKYPNKNDRMAFFK